MRCSLLMVSFLTVFLFAGGALGQVTVRGHADPATEDAFVSYGNSTTTALDAEETFTGEWEDVLYFRQFSAVVETDQDGTLYFDHSDDGVTALAVSTRPVSANIGDGSHFLITPKARYVRVRYVNGATPQGSLRIQTIANSGATEATLQLIDGKLPALVTTHNMTRMSVTQEAHPCPDNSTTDLLAAGATYTGDWTDTATFGIAQVVVYSDVASASKGVVIQYSHDESTVIDFDDYTLVAGEQETWNWTPSVTYLRVIYTNGPAPQTAFFIQTTLRPGFKPSSHRADDTITAEDDAELNISILTAQKPNGDYTNIDATAGGNLKVSIEEQNGTADLATATGQTDGSQRGVFTPYGFAASFGDLTGVTPVWFAGHNAAVPATWETLRHASSNMIYLAGDDTFTIVSDSAEDDPVKADMSAGTGCHSAVLIGLDASGNPQSETIATNGTAEVTGSLSYHRPLFVYCDDVGTGGVNAGELEIEDTGNSGVFLTVAAGEGQDHDAVYTVPAGKTLYIVQFRGSEVKGKETEITIWFRPEGKSWRAVAPWLTKEDRFNDPLLVPISFAAGTDIEIRGLAADGAGRATGGCAGFYK